MCKRIISRGVFILFFQMLFWGSIVGQKSKKWSEMTKNYVCASTPYLSKHTSYDRGFCCTSLKWWHLQMLFSFLQNFGFLCCQGGGAKRQKMAQNDKKFCLTSYLRKCTPYDCGFWYTCVNWWYLQQIFWFFQKSDFWWFLKFINKCQKEILRCAPPSSHV